MASRTATPAPFATSTPRLPATCSWDVLLHDKSGSRSFHSYDSLISRRWAIMSSVIGGSPRDDALIGPRGRCLTAFCCSPRGLCGRRETPEFSGLRRPVSDVVAALLAEGAEWACAGFAPLLALQSIWSRN